MGFPIHDPKELAVRREAPHVLLHEARERLLPRSRRIGDVRRHEHVVERPQRMVVRERLRVGDVEARARHLAPVERPHESTRVHEASATDVEEPAARPEPRELGGAAEAARLARERRRQDRVVAPLEQFVEPPRLERLVRALAGTAA
jgi:hypothetical protein